MNLEPVVDVISSDSIKSALDAAIQELVVQKDSRKSICNRWQDFKQIFIKQFKLDELTVIKLVARHHYDLILNSAAQHTKNWLN